MRNPNDIVILVVEDNPDDAMLSVRTLRKELPKARVIVARDGEQAMGCIVGRIELDDEVVEGVPDFILLDLKLPKLSGDGVLRELRGCASTALVPVVVFSSSDDPNDVRDCYSAGANSYVCKPVDYGDYVESVRSVTQYWFMVAKMPEEISAVA